LDILIGLKPGLRYAKLILDLRRLSRGLVAGFDCPSKIRYFVKVYEHASY
jgi:hypothetical protein